MLTRHRVRPRDKSRSVGELGQAKLKVDGYPSFEFFDISDAPFNLCLGPASKEIPVTSTLKPVQKSAAE
jgi:hypothetical protein